MPRRVTARTPTGTWKTTPQASSVGEEAVVVLGAHLDVELAVVEVEEEAGRSGEDDEVAEGDAGEEEHRDQRQDRQDRAPRLVAERRQQEGVGLERRTGIARTIAP